MDAVSDYEREGVEDVEPRVCFAETGPISCSRVTCTEERYWKQQRVELLG